MSIPNNRKNAGKKDKNIFHSTQYKIEKIIESFEL